MAWWLKGFARTLVELIHIVIGVVATAVIAALSAWAVPNAAETIWGVALVAMVVVTAMGGQPLRAAWRADRAHDG